MDFICRNCGRTQSAKIERERGGVTFDEALSYGWVLEGESMFCPFCAGNEEKLRKVFGV